MTPSSKPPPKGSLKSTKNETQTKTKDELRREKAIFHARLIQQQKEMELRVLASIETLLDYPKSAIADPTNPSDSDADFFRDSLRLFRTCDYDDLIEERNIDKKCGYALCPRPCREEDMSVKYRVLHSRGNPDIVETRKMQKWCSKSCARHALYARLQLSQEPAWLRPVNANWTVELLNEVESPCLGDSGSVEELGDRVLKLKSVKEANVDEVTACLRALAVERGQPSRTETTNLADIVVKENDIRNSKVVGPVLMNKHNISVEGYMPKELEKAAADKEANIFSYL